MPVAAMHEHGLASARKHKVGTAGQVALMQAEAVAEPVRDLADHHLRLSILPADSAHQPRSRVFIDNVHLNKSEAFGMLKQPLA